MPRGLRPHYSDPRGWQSASTCVDPEFDDMDGAVAAVRSQIAQCGRLDTLLGFDVPSGPSDPSPAVDEALALRDLPDRAQAKARADAAARMRADRIAEQNRAWAAKQEAWAERQQALATLRALRRPERVEYWIMDGKYAGMRKPEAAVEVEEFFQLRGENGERMFVPGPWLLWNVAGGVNGTRMSNVTRYVVR